MGGRIQMILGLFLLCSSYDVLRVVFGITMDRSSLVSEDDGLSD